MEVQILSQKFVKPSVPTPDHLRNMKLTIPDQCAPPAYLPMVYYYSADAGAAISDTDESCNKLEKSLSEILTIYYPLAGRYIEEMNMVDCNDEGALFVEAKVNGKLDQILQGEFEVMLLNNFIPFEDEMKFSPIVLGVQINKFECGGLAVGVCLSHRVSDGFSMSSFVKAWATACRAGKDEVLPRPGFDAGSLFPATDAVKDNTPSPRGKIVTRRLVFDADGISCLKAKATADGSNTDSKAPPSRVQAVIALLWKALISAAQAKHGRLRPHYAALPFNFRGKTAIPTTDNLCGNLHRMAAARFSPKESDVELHSLVSLIGDAFKKANEECSKVSNSEDMLAMICNSLNDAFTEVSKGEADINGISSMCRFPFYETDFGWGKPAWFSLVNKPSEMILLVDTRCGSGVEAWVSLEEKTMLPFEQDQDIRTYTSKIM